MFNRSNNNIAARFNLFVVAFVLNIIIVPSCLSVDQTQSVFDNALKNINLKSPYFNKACSEYKLVENEAAGLAKVMNSDSIEFLKRKAQSNDINAIWIAVLTLSRMEDAKAVDALEDLIINHNNNYSQRMAMLAFGTMPADAIRPALHRLIVDGHGDASVLIYCSGLLAAVGDNESIVVLDKLSNKYEDDKAVCSHIKSAAVSLKYCLHNVNKNDIPLWRRQELAYWIAIVDLPNFAVEYSSYQEARRRLVASNQKFTFDFLKLKLELDQPLAVILMSTINDSRAAESLKPHVQKNNMTGSLSRISLMEMKSSEACRVLETGIGSPDPLVVKDTFKILPYCGDEQTIKLLKELSVRELDEEKRSMCLSALEKLEYRQKHQLNERK